MFYLARLFKDQFNRPLPEEYGQKLSEHLQEVAQWTADGLPFEFQKVGWYAGLWHDLGKYIPSWQKYLRGESERINHSSQGAMLALELCQHPTRLPGIAFVIAGHHAGLKSPKRLESADFEQDGANWQIAVELAQQELDNLLPDKLPDIDLPTLRREFAIRMLFSALVDADRLSAMLSEQRQQTPHATGGPALVRVDLQSSFNPRSLSGFDPQSLPFPVNEIDKLRNVFAEHCIAAASTERGLFRLTGACGIGKTRSSLRFAVVHAQHNGMKGIVYVGPLKSIIEQTAEEYRNLLGVDNVLEHHSGFEPVPHEASHYKLDTERWDKPVIVTSGVQFYESLFSDRPGKCRKLHNLANRVILLDEAQTLPLNLAIPILDVLQTLSQDWGCTIVLMSATQPAFDRLNTCQIVNQALDIVPQSKVIEQFHKLERVTYRVKLEQPWTWKDLAADLRVSGHQQSLTVVNTTRLAREGFEALSQELLGSWFHLSARMCPAHRDQVLKRVRSLLEDKSQPCCHLISTQLIEAGVNIDFPRAYRQLGPLDSVIQTAGRCNRHQMLNKNDAIVTIFTLVGVNQLPKEYRDRIEITRAILLQNNRALDQDMLESIQLYFWQVYNTIHAGGQEIQKLRQAYNYPEVAKRFRVIDDDWQQSVVVPWEKGGDLISKFQQKDSLTAQEWRQLQQYIVGLPSTYQDVTEYPNGMRVWTGKYDMNFGACTCAS